MSTIVTREQSKQCFERACKTLVGGVNSPVRAFRAVGGEPVFVQRVRGPYVYDVDGNEYVDLVGTWGPAIVGHARDEVVEAVTRAARDGLSFGACCPSEAELGELIVGALPSAEMIRFVNSGTEACMSAMRLVRAATGRDNVIKFLGCYHGHTDALLVAAGSGAATFGVPDSAGVPKSFAEHTLLAPYNDLDAVRDLMERHAHDVAAIMVEPIAGNMGFVRPEPGFLEGLRELCDHYDSLLVFDEVMTGFRVAWGGYQTLCDVIPDLTCLGKVIGGGMPVAAYAGPRAIMERVSPLGPVYQAGTLSGNPLGMAAGLATLKLCQADGFYDRLQQKAERIAGDIVDAAKAADIPATGGVVGGMLGFALAPEPVRNFEDAQRANHDLFGRVFRAMLDRGVWLPPSGYEAMFVSDQHDETAIDRISGAARDAFTAVRS